MICLATEGAPSICILPLNHFISHHPVVSHIRDFLELHLPLMITWLNSTSSSRPASPLLTCSWLFLARNYITFFWFSSTFYLWLFNIFYFVLWLLGTCHIFATLSLISWVLSSCLSLLSIYLLSPPLPFLSSFLPLALLPSFPSLLLFFYFFLFLSLL